MLTVVSFNLISCNAISVCCYRQICLMCEISNGGKHFDQICLNQRRQIDQSLCINILGGFLRFPLSFHSIIHSVVLVHAHSLEEDISTFLNFALNTCFKALKLRMIVFLLQVLFLIKNSGYFFSRHVFIFCKFQISVPKG